MNYRWLHKSGVLLFAPLILVLLIAVACKGDTGPAGPAGPEGPPGPAGDAGDAGVVPAPTIAKPSPIAVVPAKVTPTGTLNIGFQETGPWGSSVKTTLGTTFIYFVTTAGETLLEADIDNNIVPQVVTDWSVDDGGTIWTLNLHEGVEFHKGWGKMTSEDVVYSMQEAAAEDGIGTFQAVYARIFGGSDAGGVTAVGDYTVRVDTGTPQFDFLPTLYVKAMAVYSKKNYETEGEEVATFQGVGTGPWEFVSESSGEFWKFKAVEDHYRKTPEFAEVVLWEMTEEATRVANFETGQLDTFTMSFDSKPRIDGLPDIRYMSVPNGSTQQIGLIPNQYTGMLEADFEERRPAAFKCLRDDTCPWVSPNPDINSAEWERARKVREALYISVDRQEVVDTLLAGEGSKLVQIFWENQYDELDPDLREWEFNPDRAKQLLIDAGYPDGFDINIMLSVRNIQGEQESCEALADYWEPLGVRGNIIRLPYTTVGPQLAGRTYVGANCHGTGGRAFPAAIMGALIAEDSGWGGGPDHPILTDFLEQIANSTPANHYEIMNDLARFMMDNALGSGYYSVNVLWPLSPRVNSWRADLQAGDLRALGRYEYASHR